MKKSIFLFFAAILCAMTANAWGYKTAAGSWNDCSGSSSKFKNVTMKSGKSQDVVMLTNVGDGLNILQNDCDGQALYCKWTKTSGDIFRGTARWNGGLYCDETVVIPGGIVYIKVGSGAQVQMTAGADYTYTADVTFSNTGESYTISGGTVSGATIENQSSMPAGGKPSTLTMSNSYTSTNSGSVHIVFDLKTNKVTETAASTPDPEPAETETVYFVNAEDWTGTISAYAYSPANAEWPGVAATKETYQIAGHDVYSYTAEKGKYANVIFTNKNGGNKQTADLVWTAGQYYCKTQWYETIADVEAALAGPVEYEYVYLINTNDWAKAHIYTWTPEVDSWPGAAMTKEAEQIAGKDVYSYKVVKGTTFGGLNFNCGGDECKTGDLVWQAGKYYAPSKNEWYDTKEDAAEALAAPVVKTYTVVGSSAPLFGTAWSTTETANDMTLVEGTKYELVKSDIALTAGDIQYKVAVDHAWTESYPTDNLTLNIPEAGKYTVTFTFDSDTKAVNATAKLEEAVVVLPTIKVKGAWDGWTANTTLTGDNTSASATVNIATAGVYEFGLDVDGDFQASGATIDKANNSTVVTGNNGNMKLTANVLGDYTFTWTYETKTLTVTYPAGEEVEIAKKYYLRGSFNGWAAKDADYELALVDGLYKKEVTLAKDAEFKVNDGADAWWGKDNLGGKTYAELDFTNDGNLKMKEEKTFTVIFNLAENLITFEGLTESTPATPESAKCYLMGIGGDWTTGIEMVANPNNENEFMLLCQEIADEEPFKFKYGEEWSSAVENEDFDGLSTVDDGNGGTNITLLEGKYDFYFKKDSKKVYIGKCIEISEEYDITITNLETEVPQPGFLALSGSESEVLGLSVQLFLNEYTGENGEYQLNEVSYLASDYVGELTFVSGSMTQEDYGTDAKIYTGTVIVELQGQYFQFNMTMYKKQLPTKTLTITGADLVVDLWNNITITAVHNSASVFVQFSDFEYVASKAYTYLMLEVGEWVDDDDDGVCDNVDYISELIEEATVTISGSTFTLKSKFEGTDANYDLTITGTLPLIIGEGDNSSVLAQNGQTADAYISRTFESGNLYTVSFPFAMNETTTKNVFGSRVEVYEYTSLTEETDGLVLNFTKLSTPQIVAGTPYLVKPNKNADGFGLSDVTISNVTNPVTYTCASTTITMEPVLTVAANAKTNGKTQYWLAEDNNLYNKSVNLKGLRAIFNVQTNKSNVRARAAFNENVETGVEDIIATDAPVKVIVNGQLIIIRDGEMYNVQGQLVK